MCVCMQGCADLVFDAWSARQCSSKVLLSSHPPLGGQLMQLSSDQSLLTSLLNCVESHGSSLACGGRTSSVVSFAGLLNKKQKPIHLGFASKLTSITETLHYLLLWRLIFQPHTFEKALNKYLYILLQSAPAPGGVLKSTIFGNIC